jgi:hypothetical protein
LSHLDVDDLTELGAWAPRAPDGSPSTAITIEAGPATRLSGQTMRIVAGSGALGHRAERELAAPVDLSALDDLELWVRCDRVADGSDARPFFLELRLGSTALAAGASSDAWQRFVPVTTPDVWQTVPLALDDLAPAVRSAVTQIRLTCVDASTPFALDLDGIAAIHPDLLANDDAALAAFLGAAAHAAGGRGAVGGGGQFGRSAAMGSARRRSARPRRAFARTSRARASGSGRRASRSTCSTRSTRSRRTARTPPACSSTSTRS